MNYLTEDQHQLYDIHGMELHEYDVCQFEDVNGRQCEGTIEDCSDDYHTSYYVFCKLKSGGIPIDTFSYPVENARNIAILKCGSGDLVFSGGDVPFRHFRRRLGPGLKKTLLKWGFTVEEHPHGFLVNKKYIIASSQRKWRVVGKNKWYYYKNRETLRKYLTDPRFN